MSDRFPIPTEWRTEIEQYTKDNNGFLPTPKGWTSYRCQETDEYYFKHESDPEQQFRYPIPLRNQLNPPDVPMRARYIHSRTRRAKLDLGFWSNSSNASWCTVVELFDVQGTWAGVLRLNHELNSSDYKPEYFKDLKCELIELSAGSVENDDVEDISFDEWDDPRCPPHARIVQVL